MAKYKDDSFTPQERIYDGSGEVDSDVFKLEVATMLKNNSINDEPFLVPLEHTHIFRTYDSNGKRLTVCTPVGGHVHEITVIQNGKVPTLKISPPVKEARVRKGGRVSKSFVSIETDAHVHTVEYRGTQKIKLRKMNVEAAKTESAVRSIQNPSLDGVISE